MPSKTHARPLGCNQGGIHRHMLTHLPYRCMVPAARHRTRPHSPSPTRQGGRNKYVHIVAMNFRFITAASTPVLCLTCSHMGVVPAHAVGSNKVMLELVRLRLVAKDIKHMGHTHTHTHA